MSRATSETKPVGPSVQTLDRGIRVVRLLADAPDGLTAGELATALDVHRAVVYRLLGTLGAHRLVVRGEDGRYRPWLGLVELSRSVATRWSAVALPELALLATAVGATAVLSVADGDDCVALAVAEPRGTVLHVAYRPGLRHPLTVGASGKAILAGRPAEPGESAAVTEARSRRLAASHGELQPGAIGIAAPVLVNGSADASVGVVSFEALDEQAEALVLAAAVRIAAALPSGASGVAA